MPFKIISAAVNVLKKHSISATNLVIALGIVGVEQVFKVAAYKCPCSDEISETNLIYGLVFLIVPAFVLFCLGFALNPTTWKLFTGICSRTTGCRKLDCYALFIIFMRASVAPASWISIAFLDGHYYACAMTSKPYKNQCVDVFGGDATYSLLYHEHKGKSQVIGWIFTAAAFAFGVFIFTAFRCCSSLTYLQAQYAELTMEIVSKTFEKSARVKIETDVLSQIEGFIKDERTKNDWDQVATIHYAGEEGDVTTYSSFQKWTRKQKGGGGASPEASGAAENTPRENSDRETVKPSALEGNVNHGLDGNEGHRTAAVGHRTAAEETATSAV